MPGTRLVIHSVVATIFVLPFVAVAGDGEFFEVKGEQIMHSAPAGWKLVWMSGAADGRYVAEYIPEADDIKSWREGYLAIERMPYPSSEALAKLRKTKSPLSAVLLHHYIELAARSCGGKHQSMSQRTNTYNDVVFAVGGGFCEKYGTAAPFGEGAFVAFAEGKDYLFRIQYAWRPRSAEDNSDLTWRITPDKAKQYLEAIKASYLCGGHGQPAC